MGVVGGTNPDEGTDTLVPRFYLRSDPMAVLRQKRHLPLKYIHSYSLMSYVSFVAIFTVLFV